MTEVDKLKKEITALKNRINNLQYVVEDKSKTSSRLSAQIVFLGYIPACHMKAFMKQCNIVIYSRQTKAQHPDYEKVLGHLTRISRKLSKAKKIHDGCRPKLRKGDRSNMYTSLDYAKFGNEIIHQYFKDNPYDPYAPRATWGVEPEWEPLDQETKEEIRSFINLSPSRGRP